MAKGIPRILVNGVGVIGKRVLDAVAKQDDMKLVGAADVVADWRVKIVARKGYPIYSSTADAVERMERAGLKVEGTLEELLKNGEVDVVVDCAPAGFGAKNKEALYDKYGVKAIFQGGEKHELAGLSFVCQCNYDEALEAAERGHRYCRVVSCNTTAACRILNAFVKNFKVERVRLFLVRRATDPVKSDTKGIMNTVVPDSHIPSHHAPDIKTVMHDRIKDIYSVAVKASHTQFHFHTYDVFLGEDVAKEDVVEALRREPRLSLVRAADGVVGLGSIIEIARDYGLPRGDIYTIPIWEDLLAVIEGREVLLMAATPNENNVVVENIDAIRAITLLERDWRKSLEKTDRSLGVPKELY